VVGRIEPWGERSGKSAEALAKANEALSIAAGTEGISLDSGSDEAVSRWRDIWAPDIRPRTLMMLIFQLFQSGVFYGFTALAPTFLLHKGISLVDTLTFSMIIYAGFFVGSVFNVFIIDKVERKWGIVGSAIIATLFGTLFVEIANVAATVVFGFLTTFVLWQFSNFLHTFQAEIFPTRVRASAAGMTYSISRLSTSMFVWIITSFLLSHGLLASYSIIWLCVVVVIAVIGLFGPLTSRRTVEAIAT
jgi:putative MFS transporter